MSRILKSNSSGLNFEVVSNPEFLAEGTAIEDLFDPDRILIGADPSDTDKKLVITIVEIYEQWVPKDRILTTNVWSSERINWLPMLF